MTNSPHLGVVFIWLGFLALATSEWCLAQDVAPPSKTDSPSGVGASATPKAMSLPVGDRSQYLEFGAILEQLSDPDAAMKAYQSALLSKDERVWRFAIAAIARIRSTGPLERLHTAT